MNKDYIVILTDPLYFPQKTVQLAELLATGFQKKICFLSVVGNEKDAEQAKNSFESWNTAQPNNAFCKSVNKPLEELPDILEQMEAAFLIIELAPDSCYSKVQPMLNVCRPLRIPYIFVKSEMDKISLQQILVPVGFLVEEKEKGIFASKLARFCGSEITFLQSKDYGSRAARSIDQIKTIFDKLALECSVLQGNKDSFTIQKEAGLRASMGEADLVIITSSREYGLDDIFFGPQERKIITSSQVPVMVLNPRTDLYVLCD